MASTRRPLFFQQPTMPEIKLGEKFFSPGPGEYDISLPIIKPTYEAIKKNSDMMIIKVNGSGESVNFKSGVVRFDNSKQLTPGPGRYSLRESEQKKSKVVHKKYSKRYRDLIDFMYHDRNKIEPMPDYKVEYNEQYEQSMKYIKNSYKRLQKKSSRTMDPRPLSIHNNSKRTPATNSIVAINSSRVNDYKSIKESYSNFDINLQQQGDCDKQLNTIDYPSPVQHLQKQDILLLHRKTFFNRNMLGMLIFQQTSNKRLKKSKIQI